MARIVRLLSGMPATPPIATGGVAVSAGPLVMAAVPVSVAVAVRPCPGVSDPAGVIGAVLVGAAVAVTGVVVVKPTVAVTGMRTGAVLAVGSAGPTVASLDGAVAVGVVLFVGSQAIKINIGSTTNTSRRSLANQTLPFMRSIVPFLFHANILASIEYTTAANSIYIHLYRKKLQTQIRCTSCCIFNLYLDR